MVKKPGTFINSWRNLMYLHHDEIKIMLEERHKDLIAQSYISKQIEEVGRTQGRPGVNWSILSMVKKF